MRKFEIEMPLWIKLAIVLDNAIIIFFFVFICSISIETLHKIGIIIFLFILCYVFTTMIFSKIHVTCDFIIIRWGFCYKKVAIKSIKNISFCKKEEIVRGNPALGSDAVKIVYSSDKEVYLSLKDETAFVSLICEYMNASKQ